MITIDISYRGPPEIIVYMVKIRAGFAVIDGITQFGCNLSGSACYNSYGGDMGGGGWFIWGGGSYFLKRGVRKKGGSWEPPEPPLATGLLVVLKCSTVIYISWCLDGHELWMCISIKAWRVNMFWRLVHNLTRSSVENAIGMSAGMLCACHTAIHSFDIINSK